MPFDRHGLRHRERSKFERNGQEKYWIPQRRPSPRVTSCWLSTCGGPVCRRDDRRWLISRATTRREDIARERIGEYLAAHHDQFLQCGTLRRLPRQRETHGQINVVDDERFQPSLVKHRHRLGQNGDTQSSCCEVCDSIGGTGLNHDIRRDPLDRAGPIEESARRRTLGHAHDGVVTYVIQENAVLFRQGVAEGNGRHHAFTGDRERAQSRRWRAGRSDQGQVQFARANPLDERAGVILYKVMSIPG